MWFMCYSNKFTNVQCLEIFIQDLTFLEKVEQWRENRVRHSLARPSVSVRSRVGGKEVGEVAVRLGGEGPELSRHPLWPHSISLR